MLYDGFELQMYGRDAMSGEVEPLFLDFVPEHYDDPGFLDSACISEVLWAISGHLLEGGAEVLIMGNDLDHIKKQFDCLNTLIGIRNMAIKFLDSLPYTGVESLQENRAAFRKMLEEGE
jgi:hypothetical protein